MHCNFIPLWDIHRVESQSDSCAQRWFWEVVRIQMSSARIPGLNCSWLYTKEKVTYIKCFVIVMHTGEYTSHLNYTYSLQPSFLQDSSTESSNLFKQELDAMPSWIKTSLDIPNPTRPPSDPAPFQFLEWRLGQKSPFPGKLPLPGLFLLVPKSLGQAAPSGKPFLAPWLAGGLSQCVLVLRNICPAVALYLFVRWPGLVCPLSGLDLPLFTAVF